MKIYRVSLFLQQNSSYLNNFLCTNVCSSQFLFDFRFKNFSCIWGNLLSFRLGEFIQFCPLFWNRSKHIIQLYSFFFITLKNRAKISFKETDNIFVNGRKEYVKFSWINSFSKLCLEYIYAFAIFKIQDIKQEKDSQHSKVCGPCPDEKDANVYFLPQKNSSELKFVLQFTVTFP